MHIRDVMQHQLLNRAMETGSDLAEPDMAFVT